eukprot:1143296-Rhodomonas_salina.1
MPIQKQVLMRWYRSSILILLVCIETDAGVHRYALGPRYRSTSAVRLQSKKRVGSVCAVYGTEAGRMRGAAQRGGEVAMKGGGVWGVRDPYQRGPPHICVGYERGGYTQSAITKRAVTHGAGGERVGGAERLSGGALGALPSYAATAPYCMLLPHRT